MMWYSDITNGDLMFAPLNSLKIALKEELFVSIETERRARLKSL